MITDNDPESFWVPLKMIDWVYICKIPREKRFLSPPASASHEFCFKNSASSSERINSPAGKIYNNLKLIIRPLSCNQFRCYLLKMSEEEFRISTLVRIHKAILKKKITFFNVCEIKYFTKHISIIDAFRWKTLMDADNGPWAGNTSFLSR